MVVEGKLHQTVTAPQCNPRVKWVRRHHQSPLVTSHFVLGAVLASFTCAHKGNMKRKGNSGTEN